MVTANQMKPVGSIVLALAIALLFGPGLAKGVAAPVASTARSAPPQYERPLLSQATPESPSPAKPPDSEKPSGDASTGFALTVAPKAVVLLRGSSSWEEGYRHITDAFKTIRAEATKAGLKPAGNPMTVFVETDDAGFRYEAMLPIENPPEGKDSLTADVKLGHSPAGKALKFQHRGAYDDIDSTYEAITAYLDEKGLEAQNLFIEEYLNEVKGADDTNLQVDIYVFVK
jgi:effector-binding domain-containing protein